MIDKIFEKVSNLESSLNSYVDKPLTANEACIFLGIKKNHLYKLTHGNKIPFYKPNGKMIYFSKSELREWALSNKAKTQDELEQEAIDYVMFGGKK